MPLPTLTKTWEFDVNIAGAGSSGSVLTDTQNQLLKLKNALKGGTAPWTVVLSSDSVTADATDRWVNIGDIIHSSEGNPHSWIVLQAPVGDQQLCINYANTQPYQIGFIWSPTAGFTGGTTTNRPTAADENVVVNDSTSIFPSSTWTSKIHVMKSTDGAETRAIVMVAGICNFAIITSELADTPAGLTDPSFINLSGNISTTDEMLDTTSLFSSNGRRRMNDGGVFSAVQLSGEAIQTSGTGFQHFLMNSSVPNDWTGEWHLGPIGVWGTAGTQRGKLGNIPDLFWGQNTVNTGDQYPASGTLYQFAQIGEIVFPWDSATVIQTS